MKYSRVIACLLLFGVSLHGAAENHLNKVYHHKGAPAHLTDQDLTIEFGNLVFYFSHDPMVNLLPTAHKKEVHEKTFFFPMMKLSSKEVKKMVRTINAEQNGAYQIQIEEAEKPIKGIKLTINYDPEKVDIQYDRFESISMQKGLVFRFFNKALLKKMSGKSKAMLRTAWHEKKNGIIIDCGHGGLDWGAISKFFNNDVKEKDVTMKVGLKVGDLLRKKGLNVFFTRGGDVDCPLDARTTFANNAQADLFVSLHANSASSSAAHGIETYYLDEKLFSKKFCTLDYCAQTMCNQLLAERCAQSKKLAERVHAQTLAYAKKKNPHVVDRRVRHHVAQVLLGSQMPAVLVELGFLSNEKEAGLLNDEQYQLLLAQGICNGVVAYLS